MFKNAKIKSVGADAATYHKQESKRGTKEFVMSSSALRAVFEKCPSAWLAGWTRSGSSSMDYGNLLDTMVLTPELFDKRYITIPAEYDSTIMECPKCGSTSESKTAKCRSCKCERVESIITKPWNNNSDTCSAWVKIQKDAGREAVWDSEIQQAKLAMARLYADKEIKSFLDACEKQVWITGEWHDEATGLIIPVQCLIDLAEREVPLTRQRIGDLKSAKNAAPLAWARWARYAGYDVQSAWNLDLFNVATNREIDIFQFVLSESEFPYEPGMRHCAQENSGDPEMDEGSSLVSGRRQYRRMMADYCQFLKNDFWPGYDDTDEGNNGSTEFRADPYEEQKRMFAPKFDLTRKKKSESPETQSVDIIP